MRFQVVQPSGRIPNNMLVYRPEDYSFDVEPLPEETFTSVVVNDISLEVSSFGIIVSVWGLCSHLKWQPAKLTPPKATLGEVIVVRDDPFRRGVSIGVNDEYWPVFADTESGWVKIVGNCKGAVFVEVLRGAILEIGSSEQLCAVWLKPEKLPRSFGRVPY
jgi:hypothetical protein